MDSRAERISRLADVVAKDIYGRLFRTGAHADKAVASNPLEEIRFRVEGAMITAAAFERDAPE